MNEPLDDTLRTLIGTAEAPVLGFHLDESKAEFELVCEFWSQRAEANRAFSLFRFFGVTQFVRKAGAYKELGTIGTTFVARDVRGTWVIQDVRSERGGGVVGVEISLGESFGSLELKYEQLSHEVIHLYAKTRGLSDWTYFEVGTNRPVDFYNPFDRPWARVM